MRDHALALAAAGWPIFPCHTLVAGACTCGRPCSSPGKHPLTRNGCLEATAASEQVAYWWPEGSPWNIGLATGAPSRSYVVDLDGDAGLESWGNLVTRYGAPPNGLGVVTGGGGSHLYFALADGETLPNTHWKLGRGIDTRGTGGYVLAPPSLHASGRRYQWATSLPMPPLPDWIRQLVTPRIATPQAPARLRGETTPYGHGVLRNALRRVAAAAEGNRNSTLNDEAFLVGQFVAGGEIDPRGVAEALEGACGDPDRPKTRTTIQRALRDGANYPRSHDAEPD